MSYSLQAIRTLDGLLAHPRPSKADHGSERTRDHYPSSIVGVTHVNKQTAKRGQEVANHAHHFIVHFILRKLIRPLRCKVAHLSRGEAHVLAVSRHTGSILLGVKSFHLIIVVLLPSAR